MTKADDQPVVDSAPFIIWTWRRTGGTNLAAALFARSSCPAVNHEPFNVGRHFGHVTSACMDGATDEQLRAQLKEILARKVLIKHCVETVPARLNALLADAAVDAGYRHVFLYRRNALDRLLSLHFASRSGVWGKKLASKTEIDDGIFSEPLPVRKLLEHEEFCRAELSSVYARLSLRGVSPAQVAFEDIYAEAAKDAVRVRLGSLLDYLGLAAGKKSDKAFVDGIVGTGEQGTRQHYARFVNYDEMVAGVQGIGEFDIRSRPQFIVGKVRPLPAGIDVAEVWAPVAEAEPGCIALSGVLLAGDAEGARVYVEDAQGLRPAEAGLASPKLAKRFPRKPAAARARFRVQGVRVPDSGRVRLLCALGDAEPVEFAAIQSGASPAPAGAATE